MDLSNKRQSVGESYGARNKHESIPIWFKRFILIVDLSLLLLVAPWHKMNAGIYQLFFDNNRFTLQFSNSETEKILRKGKAFLDTELIHNTRVKTFLTVQCVRSNAQLQTGADKQQLSFDQHFLKLSIANIYI